MSKSLLLTGKTLRLESETLLLTRENLRLMSENLQLERVTFQIQRATLQIQSETLPLVTKNVVLMSENSLFTVNSTVLEMKSWFLLYRIHPIMRRSSVKNGCGPVKGPGGSRITSCPCGIRAVAQLKSFPGCERGGVGLFDIREGAATEEDVPGQLLEEGEAKHSAAGFQQQGLANAADGAAHP